MGSEFADAGESLRGITKTNRIGILVSNESLTALQWFEYRDWFPGIDGAEHRLQRCPALIYDALFDLNLEVDFLDASAGNLAGYVLIVPALYVASQATTDRLGGYVAGGGHLISTFRSFVADEHVKVWDDRAPHGAH